MANNKINLRQGYIIKNQKAPHFLTFTVVDWVDVFTRKKYRDTFLETLQFCQSNKGLILYGYVIMSNHVHLIAQSEEGKLSDLIRDIKKFAAQKILAQITESGESRTEWMMKRFEFSAQKNTKGSNYNFWQTENHPEEIFSEEFMLIKLNYIHMNPVDAGWVARASDYLYSSASNYVGKESLIPITLIEIPAIKSIQNTATEKDLFCW